MIFVIDLIKRVLGSPQTVQRRSPTQVDDLLLNFDATVRRVGMVATSIDHKIRR
jgi:hypothetical protein